MRSVVTGLGLCLIAIVCFGQGAVKPSSEADSADSRVIRQLEMDWLQAESTTDPIIVERLLAKEYVNLTPTGTGPGKAELVKQFNDRSGNAPPYSVRQHNMRIFILNDTSAVATYVKEYVAKENGNVAREDTTDIFTKDGQTWKIRLSRTSPHTSEN